MLSSVSFRGRVPSGAVSGPCLPVEEAEERDPDLQHWKDGLYGAKSERLAHKAVLNVVDELKRDGIVILGRPEITIQNIVASAGLGARIDLEKAVYGLKKTMYEPEQLPGLIYRMDEPKVVILVFASGKLVVQVLRKRFKSTLR